MPAHRLLPDDAALRRDRSTGLSYDEIASKYGVTKGAVYLRLSAMGETKPRAHYASLLPWRVSTEHAHSYPAMMLRLLGRRIAGKPNPENKDRMLDRWLEELRTHDAVVTYDPSIPPNPASPTRGGWAYVARQPEDGAFNPSTGAGIIRKPERRAANKTVNAAP